MPLINIKVPNNLLREKFVEVVNKIGLVCVQQYYGSPKNIYISPDMEDELRKVLTTEHQQISLPRHFNPVFYSPFGAYRFVSDGSKERNVYSIVEVEVSDASYREKLHAYWVRGKRTVELDDFLNWKTRGNKQEDTTSLIAGNYPKYFVELTFKIPYAGVDYYSKFYSRPSDVKFSLTDGTEWALNSMTDGLNNTDYPELIQLGDDEAFNDVFDIQLYNDKDCKDYSGIIAHRPLDAISEHLVESKIHKSLLVMLKDYEGNWFPSSGLTKLDDEDLEYILRNYPKIDSGFKQTFDIMTNEVAGGPARVEKFIKKEKAVMRANSHYYVEEMTTCTEDDGKIYAEPALISDLMFY